MSGAGAITDGKIVNAHYPDIWSGIIRGLLGEMFTIIDHLSKLVQASVAQLANDVK